MSGLESYYDVLFELSNEDRHRILLQLDKEAMNVTNLAKILGLSFPETSRHISRLSEVGLAKKDVKGFYHLTPYGSLILRQLLELKFISQHKKYFTNHVLEHIPKDFVKCIGDFTDSVCMDDVMEFLYYIDNIIREAKEFIWLLVDQYPLVALGSIVEAIKRGVKFKIIEGKELVSGPFFDLESSQELKNVDRTRYSPLVINKTLETIDIFLILTESKCVVAFPNQEGKFDYRGFVSSDDESLNWCKKFFNYYWEKAEERVYISPTEYKIKKLKPIPSISHDEIIIEGKNDPLYDVQALQEAVDNFNVVILRGTFNLGESAYDVDIDSALRHILARRNKATVIIRRSVIIRGDGREKGIPLTKLYKKGWKFPSRENEADCMFFINGEGINVTIENIHVTDFNSIFIYAERGNNLKVLNNRITLETGIGRGHLFGQFGDVIYGINCMGSFPGGVIIEGNHLDFALSYIRGGYFLPTLSNDPEHRPDLVNHVYYTGIGINVLGCAGKVFVRNNEIRNMNSRGISSVDHSETAEIYIKDNVIVSDVYGSYPFFSRYSGFAIMAQSGSVVPSKGFYVEIENNSIRCSKINYCGIGIYGPVIEGSGKLSGGLVNNNEIHLDDGSIGIQIRKCDGFEVTDNRLSGKSYYGLQTSGRRKFRDLDLRAFDNIMEKNNMRKLEIKPPDKYSNNHADGRMFAGSQGNSISAHVWLDAFSNNNIVKIRRDESVIDEGEDNTIIYEDNDA